MRSGREVEVRTVKKPDVEKSKSVAGDTTSGDEVVIEDSNNKGEGTQQAKQALMWEYQPRVPYLARLKKDKKDANLRNFWMSSSSFTSIYRLLSHWLKCPSTSNF